MSVIRDLHISLSIGDCRERERARPSKREAMSICEAVKTQKWYYLRNTRSAYFPREREALSIHEMVNTQQLYYLHITRSAYFPINRRLHRESKRERGERESELTAYLATSSEMWTHIWFLYALHLGHFIWQFFGGGLNLPAYLGTSSEHFDSYLILVTSSDKVWGDIW